MSHLSKIDLTIYDLSALKEACKSLGLTFCQNQKTFKWYGGNGQCDHAIKVPGADYEIGIKENDQHQFDLQWDDFSAGGLVDKLGKKAGRLKQAYAVAKITKEARQKKYCIRQQTVDNGIQLVLS